MSTAEDDSWGITESVGATALLVAAARAAETASENPLISDPFARVFIEAAAGHGLLTVFVDPTRWDEIDADLRTWMWAMTDFMAARTAFFDQFFLDAAKTGLRQVVILAAGLDSRAWRLPWPHETAVFELDQPKVLEFKTDTLRRRGASPTANLVSVPVDLRQDWPKALQQAGFDPSKPTAWSAEGLVQYMPESARKVLFERIHALSAAGSWLAVNTHSEGTLDPDRVARQRDRMQRLVTASGERAGMKLPDIESLWYAEHTDVAQWLQEQGWEVAKTPVDEVLARCGRGSAHNDALPPTTLVSARRRKTDTPA
jgi:methyltransferase (TIGR00027 family)